MTYSIETPDGTFTGETLEAVNREARKAKRIAHKEAARSTAARKIAQYIAKANGFHLYRWLAEGPPRGIRFYSTAPNPYVSHNIMPGKDGDTCLLQFGDDTRSYFFWGYRVLGTIQNGSGIDLAVVLQEMDLRGSNSKQVTQAVGVYDHEVIAVPMDKNFQWTRFKKEE